jgi:hypothetical protein
MALEEIRVEDIMRDTLGTTNLNDLHSTKYEKGETKMEQLRVIMTLVFDGNPEKNTSGTFNYVNYGSEYFPQIKSFNKYWDITGSIDEVISMNTKLDYDNYSKSKDNSTLYKIAYLVTDELYRSVTNDFYFDPRDLSEDIANGRFFDRDLHEELVKAFFNTPEYLHELDISGVMNTVVERDIAKDTNHLKFVTNDNLKLLIGKDVEPRTAKDIIEYKDTQYVEGLVNRYEEYRKELKQFIFDLGKKGLDNDTLQPLINAVGTLKEVNEYLKEADAQFKNLYKEKFSEAPNVEYITETRKLKNEKYEEGNGEPEFITQTCILPNPNYVKETNKGDTAVKTIQDEFIKKINEIGNDIAIRNALSPEQREIVSKKVEEFSNEAGEILKRMAAMTNKALANMEKFGKENKEDK